MTRRRVINAAITAVHPPIRPVEEIEMMRSSGDGFGRGAFVRVVRRRDVQAARHRAQTVAAPVLAEPFVPTPEGLAAFFGTPGALEPFGPPVPPPTKLQAKGDCPRCGRHFPMGLHLHTRACKG